MILQYLMIADSKAAVPGIDDINLVIGRSNSHGGIVFDRRLYVIIEPRNST